MTSLPKAGQEQPSLQVLLRKSSNTARQTAMNRSTSAYAVQAVGSKGHKDPASMSAPTASASPVMADNAGNMHNSLQTLPTTDTTASVSSVEHEQAALAAVIPGQVDAQEHRSDCPLAASNRH